MHNEKKHMILTLIHFYIFSKILRVWISNTIILYIYIYIYIYNIIYTVFKK